jgi:hypothetical protein
MLKIIFGDFISVFYPPGALALARIELEQAQRELLKAHSAQEYARNIAVYNTERIERLTAFINQQDPACQSTPSHCGTNAPAPTHPTIASTSSSAVIWKKSWR